MKPSFLNLFMKKFTRERVVPIISDSVFYIKKGGVKLSVISRIGKEAVVAMLGPTDLFGEACVADQTLRIGSATAITPITVLLIARKHMAKVLHEQNTLADWFIAHMVLRNVRIEQDLIYQLGFAGAAL